MAAAAALLAVWSAPLAAAGAGYQKPFDPKAVTINIEHGIALPWKKPGFRISIENWMPNEALSITAISPTGAKIELVPQAQALLADEDGNMTVDIDYARKGLAPGHWVLVIAGKPGAHIIETDLPVVEAPTKSNPNWKLDFGKASDTK